MRRSLPIPGVVALVLTVLSSVAVAKDARLKFAPENKKLHYKMDVQQEVFVQGFEIVTNHTGEIEVAWLEKTEDGKAKISVRFTNVEGTMKQGDNLTEQNLGINGKEIWVTVSERGEVDEIVPQAVLDDAKTQLVQDLIENLVAFLPEDEIGEGDSWVQERITEGATPDDPPAVEGEMEYWLEELKEKDGLEVARIVGEGKADINMMTPGGMLVGEAKGDVEYVIAVHGGYMVQGKSFTEVKGKMGTGQELSQVRRFECELK